MRKIVAGMMVSADGVVEAPETWTGPYFSPELGQHVGSVLAVGIRCCWAGHLSDLRRRVRGQHQRPDGRPDEHQPPRWSSRPPSGARTGRTLRPGGRPLPRVPGGLLDELQLLVHPVVAGTGRHLFEAGTSQVPLTLLHSQPLTNGVIALSYVRAG